MQTVADEAGLSVGFISQIERGLTAPSLSSLATIAEVLGASIPEFLDRPKRGSETTRQAMREVFALAASDMSYERISSSFRGSQLYSVIVHEPPGHRGEPISHRGEEMFFVLAGEVTVEIEGTIDVLRSGDSVHFDSTRVHSTWNDTDRTASFLWCGTMDIFGDAPGPIHESAPVNEGQPNAINRSEVT
ncbi:probable transcriptional regulator [Oceanicola granulosus HTCC2516]|uniref:Probable transcriptional regulator n=2 Tax=Oceanicola granulosus TaxID=252302 RepID=Q2CGQ2_OCEGH|nr:probable transcriptional regulator [Oceanicola granulosus HTCC2516]